MKEPVITSDGHTYEKVSIELWLRDHDTSPNTNMKLDDKVLIPNSFLKQRILEWKIAQLSTPKQEDQPMTPKSSEGETPPEYTVVP
jgi:hypothetical protein